MCVIVVVLLLLLLVVVVVVFVVVVAFCFLLLLLLLVCVFIDLSVCNGCVFHLTDLISREYDVEYFSKKGTSYHAGTPGSQASVTESDWPVNCKPTSSRSRSDIRLTPGNPAPLFAP